MSGPKGYGYSVNSAELDRQRAVTAARARCDALRMQIAADAARAAAYGRVVREVGPPHIANASTAAEADAAAARYAEQAAVVRSQAESARRAGVAAAFADHLPAELSGSITIEWRTAPPSAAETAPAASEADAPALAAGILSALTELADETRREAWFAQATRLAEARETQLLRTLAREVDAGLREQRRVDELRREAGEIAATVAGLPEARAIASDAERVDDREGVRALAARARSAREAQRRRDEREFVIAETASALRELGYDIDDEFRSIALDGGFAVATRTGLDDHALQVRFGADGRVLTNTVALAAETSVDGDIAAEDATCADLDRVTQRVADSGVALERTHARASGAVPIERRLDRAGTRESIRKKHATSSRERTR